MVMDHEAMILDELHNQSTSRDNTILATRRLGGGLTVEGFRKIDAAALIDICTKYGQRFVVNLKAARSTVRIDFREANFSVAQTRTGVTGCFPDDIALIFNGDITSRSESGNTEHFEVATDSVCSEDLERVLAIQEVSHFWKR